MNLRVLHRTTFTYAGKAHDSFNETRLRPLDDSTQRCHDFKLRLTYRNQMDSWQLVFVVQSE